MSLHCLNCRENSSELETSAGNIHRLRYLKCKVSRNSAKQSQVDSKTNTVKCLLCNKMFDKIGLYRKHMAEHRNSKKFKCIQCNASYNVEDNFKLHMAIHSRGPPSCPLCDRKFQRIASLKSHLIVHEVDEMFTCAECLAEYEREVSYLFSF